MPISRIDLTGAGSPEALVKRILHAEPDLSVPVPIQDLCACLGIIRIEDLDTDEFEGGLVTDAKRSDGTILARRGGEPRRRFTIAHELGHFLMAHHIPDQPDRFLCKKSDMLHITAKAGDQRQRREVEANRFANLLLMPPHLLRGAMTAFHEPDLQHVLALARDFAVGRETAARAYVQYHAERIAIVVAGHGRVQRCYRSLSFPAIVCAVGSPVPEQSLFHSSSHQPSIPGGIAACSPDVWIDVKRDLHVPSLDEQVYLQQSGFAMILLRLKAVPEDSAEERRLEEGWRHRFHSGRR
ncbi:ImmA/IrrE family metallo-endopeptidase [Methylobacterium sp. WL30]|uniref:ImmA/IrrE family metallo-endopeptidase n=1 Tax=unclassified Methylobacterium TaxID=2615210 RepID=UPI0011C8598F|nr:MULTISPECIES: ImmA/IrrE family metallo-endopeptidase [unclassified Methylobacterium]TXM94701.1 ImmA/IrrE family metallo-endopeptidase [Methylobacterium sp. WL116]TXN40808.1 ImmA/IrrE family metallo-endopeptidase [Methylobacterium sp. WL93]TXN50736.1 ImmA/IrrE family metallo-endopeptidase [Methylobacterium sp. WL119]TXN67841.1 ImmA/IrrE family metallo-endopeptidase [Methylobacterium sp. WL30]